MPSVTITQDPTYVCQAEPPGNNKKWLFKSSATGQRVYVVIPYKSYYYSRNTPQGPMQFYQKEHSFSDDWYVGAEEKPELLHVGVENDGYQAPRKPAGYN